MRIHENQSSNLERAAMRQHSTQHNGEDETERIADLDQMLERDSHGVCVCSRCVPQSQCCRELRMVAIASVSGSLLFVCSV